MNLDLPPVPYNNDDDDDDFNIPDKYPSSNGGSNIVSLLKLATGLLSGSSGSSVSTHTDNLELKTSIFKTYNITIYKVKARAIILSHIH